MKYPEYTIKILRSRLGAGPNDTSVDGEIEILSNREAFREILTWYGFGGTWDSLIKRWIRDIYGIGPDEEN